MISKHNIIISILFLSVTNLLVIIIVSILFVPEKTMVTSLNPQKCAASLGSIEKDGKEIISIQPDKIQGDTDKSKIDKTMHSMYQSF